MKAALIEWRKHEPVRVIRLGDVPGDGAVVFVRDPSAKVVPTGPVNQYTCVSCGYSVPAPQRWEADVTALYGRCPECGGQWDHRERTARTQCSWRTTASKDYFELHLGSGQLVALIDETQPGRTVYVGQGGKATIAEAGQMATATAILEYVDYKLRVILWDSGERSEQVKVVVRDPNGALLIGGPLRTAWCTECLDSWPASGWRAEADYLAGKACPNCGGKVGLTQRFRAKCDYKDAGDYFTLTLRPGQLVALVDDAYGPCRVMYVGVDRSGRFTVVDSEHDPEGAAERLRSW